MADYAGSEQKYPDGAYFAGDYVTDFSPQIGSAYNIGNGGGTPPAPTIREEPGLPRREP